jgi:phosphate-induced protein 1
MRSTLGKMKSILAFLFVILAANFLMAQNVREGTGVNKAPDGAGHGVHDVVSANAQPTGNAVVTGNGINYNGGPVMKGTVNTYIIWYGNWNGTGSNTPTTQAAIQTYLSNLNNTAPYLVNTTYGDASGNVSGLLNFGGSTTVNSSTNLSDSGVLTQVSNAITSGRLPKDTNGLYFVLSSSNIRETSGFCTRYCGWHTHGTVGGSDIKYSFVGNVDRCPSGCEIQPTGPNSPAANLGGIDGMANVMFHELSEAVSDPDLNAWFDSSGQENGDKCNFNFGATSTCNANGLCTAAGSAAAAKYNQTFGNHNYMLQQMWENANGGACVQHL